MKKIYSLLIGFLTTITTFAQAPQKMNYQAIVRNASNELVSSADVGMRISILQGSATGNIIYVETHTPHTNGNGLATIEIGDGNVVSGSFGAINWGAGTYFIKTETDPTGGTNYNITGTSQMLSVPYAMYAASAGGGNAGTPGVNVGDMQYWTGNSWVNIPIGQPGQMLQVGTNGLPQWNGSRFGEVITSPVTHSPVSNTIAFFSVTVLDNGLQGSNSSLGIQQIGICYGPTPNPTIENQFATAGENEFPNYSGMLFDLIPGATYYMRAFLQNSAGFAYGNELTFTQPEPAVPTVSTTAVTQITSGTALLGGGHVSHSGGSPVLTYGVCWAAHPNPTIEDTVSPRLGPVLATQLAMNTTYYVRAFATNSTGTGYGNEIAFTTTGELSVGSMHLGGIIAYILQPGDPGYIVGESHGLIIAPSGQSNAGPPWGCIGTSVGTSQAFGTGASNTLAIVNACPETGSAARICHELVLNGFDDWYLPSSSEFERIYQNRHLLGGFQEGTGNSGNTYWSSSETLNAASTKAIAYVVVNGGGIYNVAKSYAFSVRAVRGF